MEKARNCYLRAKACQRMARKAQDVALAAILQSMSRQWTALAHQTERYVARKKVLKRKPEAAST